jgi:hypothetical protein
MQLSFILDEAQQALTFAYSSVHGTEGALSDGGLEVKVILRHKLLIMEACDGRNTGKKYVAASNNLPGSNVPLPTASCGLNGPNGRNQLLRV